MARFMRTDLFQVAKKHGWKPGTHLDKTQREKVEAELKVALQQSDLAPTRVFEDNGAFRSMSLDEAVNNLIEELV